MKTFDIMMTSCEFKHVTCKVETLSAPVWRERGLSCLLKQMRISNYALKNIMYVLENVTPPPLKRSFTRKFRSSYF